MTITVKMMLEGSKPIPKIQSGVTLIGRKQTNENNKPIIPCPFDDLSEKSVSIELKPKIMESGYGLRLYL